MKTEIFFAVLAIVGLVNRNAIAGTTPMGQEIQEGKEFRIKCEYQKVEKDIQKAYAKLPAKGTYHYKVVLPDGYHTNKGKYPCIFVACPGGYATVGNMRDYVTKNKWITILLVESKNEAAQEVMMGNFLAAHDDAVQRFRIQEGLKFATGFSGGARCSSYNAGMREGFGGFILQGAGFGYNFAAGSRYEYDTVENNPHMAVYMIMGKNDSNKSEIEKTSQKVTAGGNPFKAEVFDGGHVWAPVECMNNALAWLELQVFSRTKDKNIFLMYFDKGFEELDNDEDTTKYERYLTLKGLIKKATKFKLTRDKKYKAKMTSLNSMYKNLAKDKSVRKEISLEKTLGKIDRREQRLRDGLAKNRVNAKKKKREVDYLKKSYQRFVDKYPDTYCARKANEKIQALETL